MLHSLYQVFADDDEDDPLSFHQVISGDDEVGPITLMAVRVLAAQCDDPWTEVYFNKKSRIVSFTRDDARINVYYTTGTVATVLKHPIRGRSQLFRAKVSLMTLRELFENPRMHTGLGYWDLHGKERVFARLVDDSAPHTPKDEETALKEQMESINEEITRLKKQHAELAESMEKVKEEREKEEAEQKRKVEEDIERRRLVERQSRIDKQLYERGRRLTYCYNKSEHKFLNAVNLRDTICIVAHPVNGTVLFSKRDGQSFWSGGGIPKAVDNALRTRIGEHCHPTAIALGTHGRYFMQFANGKELWHGSDSFDNAVYQGTVKMVAFGEYFSSYFVLYKSGSCTWLNIPQQLENYVRSRRKDLPGVDFVSLGDKNQYFVRFEDGSWRASVFSTIQNELVDETNAKGHIRQIMFGGGGIIVRYN